MSPAKIAQLVERQTRNGEVPGSNLTDGESGTLPKIANLFLLIEKDKMAKSPML